MAIVHSMDGRSLGAGVSTEAEDGLSIARAAASVASPDDRVRGRLRVVLRAIRWAGQDINSLVVHTMDGPFNYAWERRPDAYKRGAVGRSIAGQGMEADLVHTMDRLFRWGFLTKDWLAPRGEGA